MKIETVDPKTRAKLRAWLRENHESVSGAWIVIWKKGTAHEGLKPTDVSEEALCFGWVDSRPNTLDARRYKLLISPRKPKSPWSKINKERVAKLIEAGLMTEAGARAISIAKKNGAWSSIDHVESLKEPPDLAHALDDAPKARAFFDAFPPSSKKIILQWIASAKTEETRAKRVAEAARLAAKNERANHWRKVSASERAAKKRRTRERPTRRARRAGTRSR